MDSIFQFEEAGIQSAKECLPFLKGKERRELPTTLSVTFAIRPKRREYLFFASRDVTEHQKKRVVMLRVRQPCSQPKRSRDQKAVLFPGRVVRVCVVNPVLKLFSTFLADADCSLLGKGDGSIVNRNLSG
jgi:hypothetical protein